MLSTIITIAVLVAVFVVWIMSTQRKLAVLDEHIRHAMGQIGVQLAGCFDALMTLLVRTKGYARQESQVLEEALQARRMRLTAKSTPRDVIPSSMLAGMLGFYQRDHLIEQTGKGERGT